MKNKSIYTLIALLFTVGFFIYDTYVKPPKNKRDTTPVAVDSHLKQYLPSSTTGQVIHHTYYTLSYNEKYEQAEWVAYDLPVTHLAHNDFRRPFFERDPKVKTKSAHYKDYSHSGYDKGHLCPAGDNRFSKTAFNETFMMSNVSPQKHDFNSGLWNRLEQKTRYWAYKYKGLYVVTGGILKEGLPTIGRNHVAVPQQYYKIILDYTKPEIKAIAFLIPHKDSEIPLYKFVTSIDRIEAITGIDFFPELPDSLENKLEASKDYKKWSFRH